MPKTPRDFSKGLIYSIVCKTDKTLIYIGSTTNFTKRKNHHKTVCHNEKNKDHNTPVYVMVRANGGWDNFEMQPVKEYACENAIQLVIEEERLRKQMQANLNARRSFLSEEEAKEIHRNYSQNYHQEHQAEAKEYKTKYYQEHQAEAKEYKTKYYQEHLAELKEYNLKYYEANKDEINKKRREKYLAKKKSASII
jgi:predicted house-cleaning noncanonical NTP pyrophosphatase (MazG superfamily)